jgi:general nucleoside transport system permease protein
MSQQRTRRILVPKSVVGSLYEIGYSVLAITIALLIGTLLIVLLGYDVGHALSSMYRGAFGSLYGFSQTLLRATPLLFTGLSVAVAFRAGLFNIGSEGQLYWGALATALTALVVGGLPSVVAVPVALTAGALAGGFWGCLPGLLKARTGAHEVITSIMLNSIAVLGTAHLTSRYFKAPGAVDQTERIVASATMPEIIAGSGLTAGVLIGIAVVAVVHWFFATTSMGFDFEAVGRNTHAAEYGGVNSKRIQVLSMSLGGAMAGTAGGVVVLSQLSRFVSNFSPGYGFTGIAVAVLGRGKPWGVLLAALLFGALDSGGMSMQLFARIPSDITTVVQGLVILLVAAPAALRGMMRWRSSRRERVDAI